MIKTTIQSLKPAQTSVAFAAAMMLFTLKASSAQELTLLTIQDDRIGEIENLSEDTSAQRIILTYYDLLPTAMRQSLLGYDEQLDSLIIDYEVALTAADSAEVTEVISDMDALWIEIQKIHHEVFSLPVIEVLHLAYGEVYPLL